jgi:hypothetical protein
MGVRNSQLKRIAETRLSALPRFTPPRGGLILGSPLHVLVEKSLCRSAIDLLLFDVAESLGWSNAGVSGDDVSLECVHQDSAGKWRFFAIARKIDR